MTKKTSLKEGLLKISFLWQKYINPSVVVKDIEKNVMTLVKSGIEIDYIIYCLTYVIKHKMNLNYPAGLKYFIDNAEIKHSYKMSKIERVELYEFNAKEDVDSPSFNFEKEERGFQIILKKY